MHASTVTIACLLVLQKTTIRVAAAWSQCVIDINHRVRMPGRGESFSRLVQVETQSDTLRLGCLFLALGSSFFLTRQCQ